MRTFDKSTYRSEATWEEDQLPILYELALTQFFFLEGEMDKRGRREGRELPYFFGLGFLGRRLSVCLRLALFAVQSSTRLSLCLLLGGFDRVGARSELPSIPEAPKERPNSGLGLGVCTVDMVAAFTDHPVIDETSVRPNADALVAILVFAAAHSGVHFRGGEKRLEREIRKIYYHTGLKR